MNKMADDLKELESYRQVGTLEEFKELKELASYKQVKKWANGTYHCPNCEEVVNYFENCSMCCQKIEWGE